jgi:succinate-semialdehyde dehydrogenase / glutarate-semialdehyde dehydrogenase
VLKGPEETPASVAGLVQALHDGGLPPGVLGLVFGHPATISGYLIPHPAIRKVSFTGSTAVGKQLAALAGSHMKRATMELGGHAPALVFEDADIASAVESIVAAKFRNAGQACIAPSRILVQRSIADTFVQSLLSRVRAIKVGNGADPASDMGPLANRRRLEALEALVADALAQGARLALGGHRIGKKGFYFAPTIVTDAPLACRLMNEEPFGPIATVSLFDSDDAAIAEANRLPYGLAAYAYTRSTARLRRLEADVEAGMLAVNHHGLGLAEVPFGGMKDSGFGSECGSEAIEAYTVTKLISAAA